ncbi:hypothetical protein HOF40_02225 [Candidatus Parcubacteria bacterium]|jgi:NTP pyrophosphatase (non-canonical NTP hydrolase)|nr:hypothetical protein [Candidatus Parcubacteria bacterium]MBT3948881.1 hypothetical protein [Candidatus Parcubacteria bacterium]
MQFTELQNKLVQNLVRYGKKHKITIDEDFALFKLFEEVGELSEAILTDRKKSRPIKHVSKEESKKQVAAELADVLGMTVVIAHLMDIDLEDALDKKWINKEK